MKKATCFAPATVANVAVGFDLLGFSFPALGDEITVEQVEEPGITISAIEPRKGLVSDAECGAISRDPVKNTATAGLVPFIERRKLPYGFRVFIRKGIPLGSGLGGSAASAVGTAVAVNALLDSPLSSQELLGLALRGEAVASGALHGDNVAPCLLGGLLLVRSVDPPQVVSIPCPNVWVSVIRPHTRVETRQARALLKKEISLQDYVRQSACLAGFIAGCFRSDLTLIRESFQDLLIEPQRQSLIPALSEIKKNALKQGAIGCAISGSGPSVFAWAETEADAIHTREVMLHALRTEGLSGDGWVAPLSSQGAKLR